MTFRVRLQPSQHEFDCEPGDNLVDAALRSGFSIDYGCSSGSCGDCKARLISGQLQNCRPHDFRLTEQEKADGWFLPCRASAASDLVLEAHEAGSVRDIPMQQIDAKVTKLDRRGEDFMILHLRTPRSSTLRFMAGQRVDLTLPDGHQHRSPIASCPCNGMQLQFHLFRVSDGAFAQSAFKTLKPGQKVHIQGPHGRFTLDDESRHPLVFIAFESSFAATMSLIEHAISLDPDRPMQLFWLARTRHCHYLANQCRAWQDSLERFEYHPMLTEESGFAQALEQITKQITAQIDPARVEVYITGPVELSRLAATQLPAQGVSSDRIYLDLPNPEPA